MRKDVKLGFAIGGVLLAVAIVFALVNTAHPPKTEETAEGSGTSTSVQPETATVDPVKPVVPEPVTPPAKPDAPVAEAAKPDAVAEKKDVFGSSTDWDQSMKTGKIEKTQMPVLAASNTSVSLPEPVTPDTKITSPKPAGPVNIGAAGVSYGTSRTPQGEADEIVKATGNTANQPVTIVATSSTARAASTHTVKAGETFSTIAAAYYGNAKYHKLITAANPKANSSNLKIGQVITLPAFDPKTEAAKTTSVSAAAEKPVDAKKEYRVQAGDNLHRICMKLYGNPKNVDAIYTLNKAAIGSDPAKLKLGMVLALPAAPTTASR